jgi:hypothetical protein
LELKRELTPPQYLDTYPLIVDTTPIPLFETSRVVKRIHVKVPSWAWYLVYLGNSARQDFILEKGDKEVIEIPDPSKVYVRSLGNVTIYIMLEY